MFKKTKIRNKFIFSLIFVLMLSLILMAFISYSNIGNITNYSEEINNALASDAILGTELALFDQAYNFLSLIAEEQRMKADFIFEGIIGNVTLIESAVQDIYTNPGYYNGRELIHLRDVTEGEYQGTWLLSEDLEKNENVLRDINLLSNLNMIMPALADNPDILQLFVGTVNGTFYNYTSLALNDPKYDPRTRPWYIDAVEKPGEVIFTDVYEDAFGGGMVMTVAKTVFINNDLIGVVAFDIQLDTLKRMILGTQILDTGYAFVLDKRGMYIVHPELGSAGFEHFANNRHVPFADGLRRMMDFEKGFTQEETEYGLTYLAFSPLSSVKWSVGVVVPESEILLSNLLEMSRIVTKASEDMGTMAMAVVWELMIVLLVSVIIILIIGILIANVITKPIVKLTKDVASFGGGEFDKRIDITTKDEIGNLAEVFNQMADNIVKNMAEIASAATERERINGELRIAAQIQADMLPNVEKKFGDNPRFNIYASVEPALEMGGDLYDIFFIDKDRNKLCEVIADVSGKGMPAAMFMVMTKTLIRNYILSGYDPAVTLRKANNRLCEDNPSSMFVTVFISVVDLETGDCVYAHAGHDPIAFCRIGGEFSFVETTNTMALGFFPDSEYPLYSDKLNPGDKIFHYTDGVTEALNESDEEWSSDALLEALNQYRNLSCAEIAKHVREAIVKHAGNALQSDDITMLITEYLIKGDGVSGG